MSSPASERSAGSRVALLIRALKLFAEHAFPLAIAGTSFVIAIDAWFEARPSVWEQQRALASVAMESEAIPIEDDHCQALLRLTISNVGQLSFAIVDLQLSLHAGPGLWVDWQDNSLLLSGTDNALPIGIQPFRRLADDDHGDARFAFGQRTPTWHVIDPGRSVEIDILQPVRGTGTLAAKANIFAQPIKMADAAQQIAVEGVAGGETRRLFREFGEGSVSDAPVFPYSAGALLVVTDELPVYREAPSRPAARR